MKQACDIVLLGGTCETAGVAGALAQAGWRVLVSTATEAVLDIGDHPGIMRRSGRLDAAGFVALLRTTGATVLADVSHPYALELRATAQEAARQAGVTYLTYLRPPSDVGDDGAAVFMAATHTEAARLAFSWATPVLLTVGARHIAPYAAEAVHTGIPVIARVLDDPASVNACLEAGIPNARIITGRGPFTMVDNVSLIRQFGIGVLVTKDGGEAGGFPAKREAARREACRLVVVAREAAGVPENACATSEALVQAVLAATRPQPFAPEPTDRSDPTDSPHLTTPPITKETPMTKKSLVLLAHGSRNPRWCKPFDELIADLQGCTGDASICLAHLQMSEPSLPAVIDGLASQGVDHIRILPMLMAGGNHADEDIPAEVAALREKYPAIAIEILPPIGSHPRFKAMLRELVSEEL
jgi:precorrin-6A/cobalt-precorrin-6A reductase